MATNPVYYKLTVGSNTLYFYITNITNDNARELWELPVPYVRDSLIYDQITTANEIQITAEVKCGSDYPYATTTLARAAVVALLADSEITACSLASGTWNGSSWSVDASYNWNLPDSGKSMFLRSINVAEAPGEFNRLKLTISLVQGAQL